MKNIKTITRNLSITAVAIILGTLQSTAQTEAPKSKDKISIKIGTDGVDVSKGDKDILGDEQKKKKGKSNTSSLVLDFGFCNFIDNTPANANYLPASFDLKTNKSLSFNITQMYGFAIVKSHLYLATGLGFNFNNYRYENFLNIDKPFPSAGPAVSYYNNYQPIGVSAATVRKSKLATNYITVPLMLQAKLGEGKKKFVIGGGISAGYLVKAWQKNVFSGNKDKKNISFAYNPFALNAIGEIGIDNRIRFYGSYALTPIHKTPLQHNAIAFGVRFGGL